MSGMMKQKDTLLRAKRVKENLACSFWHRNVHFCKYGCAKVHCLAHSYNRAKACSTICEPIFGVRRQRSCTGVFVSGPCSVKARVHSAERLPPQCKRYVALFVRRVSVVTSGRASFAQEECTENAFPRAERAEVNKEVAHSSRKSTLQHRVFTRGARQKNK